jgi:hypothetical protein
MINDVNNPNNPHIFGLDRFIPFFGIVEDRDDPLCLGRCKVRIFGVHPDDKEQVTTQQLPWAFPVMPIIGNAALGGIGHAAVGPVVGTNVVGFFADGYDRQQPFFFGCISGGSGQFGSGASQNASPDGADGNSAYGPQGDPGSLQSSQPLGTLDSKKSVHHKGADIAAVVMNRFGLKDFQAAAVVANLILESGGGLEVRREIGKGEGNVPPPINSGGIGWGLAQWTNSKNGTGRYRDFCNWAQRNGKDIKNYNHNVEFFLYELSTTKQNVINGLKKGGTRPGNKAGLPGPYNVDTIQGATGYFCAIFEVPAARYAHIDRRIEHARKVWGCLQKSGAPVRSTGTQPPR